jgi:hypothetical protein
MLLGRRSVYLWRRGLGGPGQAWAGGRAGGRVGVGVLRSS